MESKIKEQAAYLASLKGADQRMSASQLMHSHGNPYGRGDSNPYAYGPAGEGGRGKNSLMDKQTNTQKLLYHGFPLFYRTFQTNILNNS